MLFTEKVKHLSAVIVFFDWQVQTNVDVDVLHVARRHLDESDSDDELFFLPTVPDPDKDTHTSGLAGKINHEGVVETHNDDIFQGKGMDSIKRQKV